MYHIPRDQRAYRSVEKVFAGLEECLKRDPIQNITVSALCEASGIGRATFYRLFDNLTDVLACRCDGIMDRAAEGLRRQEILTVKELSLQILKSWMVHPLLMRALVEGQHIGILYQSHRRHRDLLLARIREAVPEEIPERLEWQLEHLCLLLPACLFVWYKNGAKETPEVLHERIAESLHLWARLL